MKRLVPLLIMITLASCSQKQETADATVETQTTTAVPVRIDVAQEQPLTEIITVYGETAPLWTLDVYPDGAGKIIEKNADIGDNVSKNDVLARLKQDIPGMDFSPSPIEAPRSGVITACMIEIGSKVNPQAPVYKLANLDTLTILVDVLEDDLEQIRVNSRCRVNLEGSAKDIQAVVNKIWPAIDPRSKTGRIEILLANQERTYRPGTTVECIFSFSGKKSLTVPLDAVIRNGMRAGIYKIEKGRAQLVSVALGPIQSADISVTGALAAGDTIVVYGQNLLREGDSISVIHNDPITE